MLPTIQSPVLMPMPISMASFPSPTNSLFSSLSAFRILTPAWMASSGWLSCEAGAFQKAIMQSPMYLSMVPSHSKISLERVVNKRLIKSVRASGSCLYCSEILVKPRISENSIVISLRSPPSFRDSLDSARRFTISGDIYCAKAPRTRLLSSSVKRKLKNVTAT